MEREYDSEGERVKQREGGIKSEYEKTVMKLG